MTPAFVLAGLYLAAALGVVLALRHPRLVPPEAAQDHPFVSVLVAARNEERDLPAALDALRRQDYPADRYEVLVADDGSTDGTAAIVRQAAAEDDRIRLVAVPRPAPGDPLQGKARALHAAYQAARGDVLLVTDADCRPPPGWASHLAAQFADPKAGIVCGVTTVRHETLLGRVQALDWLLLLATASASAIVGRPLTAMGNNMAFRRAAYEAVGGYPALRPSVTEDYALFQAVHRTGRWRVRLLLDAGLHNETLPLPTLRAVVRQRKRWARGGLRAPGWAYGLYALTWLSHAAPLAGLLLAPATGLVLLAAKLAADFAILTAAARRLGHRAPLQSFLPFEAYLFAYIIAMPLVLLLRPAVTWKGRVFGEAERRGG